MRTLCRCAHVILLSDQGHTIDKINGILQVLRDAVFRWHKQLQASWLNGLIEKPRSNRTPILNGHDHQLLQEIVAQQLRQIQSF